VSEPAVDRLDHLVLTVRDVDATCAFYRRVLGMEPVTFGEGRVALRFGRQKINVHPLTNAHALVAESPTPGSSDVCFLTDVPVQRWLAHLDACDVTLLGGPVRRSGAEGPIESVYFRDPDGNLVEVSNAVEPGGAAGDIEPLRQWLRRFASHVRAVDFDAGRAMCDEGLVAFGTVAEFVVGIDRVIAEQWRRVWPNIRDFTIRADEARGGIAGDHGWVAAPWDSVGVRDDGSTFARPGRMTIILRLRDGRWLATHTHVSLSP
jgi:catechol 2,3-dioxygenase-like lactoylglutathione lyase family enzyme/ketosteroid isomerase-like protein